MPRPFHVVATFIAGLSALGASASSSAAAPQGENLVVDIPQEFQLGDQGQQGPGADIAEYIPKGETVDDWSRMITVQVFHNLKAFDPNRFGVALKGGLLGGCPGAQGTQLKSGRENGYAFSLWLYTCPLNPKTGKPETLFDEVISGADSLYSVQYALRSALKPDLMPPITAYLSGVRVCDSRLPDRPCPTMTSSPSPSTSS